MKVKLRYAIDTTTTVASSWRFGLAQFWNQKPGYYDEYMKIYKMSRITKTSIKCTVINQTAATPAEIVAVVLPYSDYSRTIGEVKTLPSAAIRYLSGSGGLDKATIRKSSSLRAYTSASVAGVRDYQQSASEAASTLALLPDTPVLALYVGGASTEPTLRVFIEVFYDVVFFEPEWPSSVALTLHRTKPYDMTARKEHSGPVLKYPRAALRPAVENADSHIEESESSSGSVYQWEKYELPPGENQREYPDTPNVLQPARGADATESQRHHEEPEEVKLQGPQADHPKQHNRVRGNRSRSTEHFTEAVKQIFSELFSEFNKKP